MRTPIKIPLRQIDIDLMRKEVQDCCDECLHNFHSADCNVNALVALGWNKLPKEERMQRIDNLAKEHGLV